MDELTAFLRARYDEAEAMTRAAILHGSGNWTTQAKHGPAYACIVDGEDITIYDEGAHTAQQAEFIAANDPASRLADITLKRAILAQYHQAKAFSDHMFATAAPEGIAAGEVLGQRTRAAAQVLTLERTVRQLGTEFSSHADYKQAWKP